MQAAWTVKQVRLLLISFLVSSVVLCCGVLSSCAPQEDTENIIRQGLEQELDQLRQLDEAAINTILEQIPTGTLEPFEALSLSPEEYFDAYFDGFDYSIGQIHVSGNTAAVNLTLEVKQPAEISSAIEDYINGLTDEEAEEAYTALTEEGQLPEWYSQGLLDVIRSVDTDSTEELKLQVERAGDSWRFSDSTADIIEAALA